MHGIPGPPPLAHAHGNRTSCIACMTETRLFAPVLYRADLRTMQPRPRPSCVAQVLLLASQKRLLLPCIRSSFHYSITSIHFTSSAPTLRVGAHGARPSHVQLSRSRSPRFSPTSASRPSWSLSSRTVPCGVFFRLYMYFLLASGSFTRARARCVPNRIEPYASAYISACMHEMKCEMNEMSVERGRPTSAHPPWDMDAS